MLDYTRSMIPGADIEVSELGNPDKSATGRSRSDGTFCFAGLGVGSFRVRIIMAGFLSSVFYPIEVVAGKANGISLMVPFGFGLVHSFDSTGVVSGVILKANELVRDTEVCWTRKDAREKPDTVPSCVKTDFKGFY
ncbi:MAG: carboxypeptidase regulatory-like domain-containing protein, partial [Bryobacteraceae bacterium]|nr:carboxypeptidase regulatory-like domain-containing protein [Bryobacteraceae bacterium]